MIQRVSQSDGHMAIEAIAATQIPADDRNWGELAKLYDIWFRIVCVAATVCACNDPKSLCVLSMNRYGTYVERMRYSNVGDCVDIKYEPCTSQDAKSRPYRKFAEAVLIDDSIRRLNRAFRPMSSLHATIQAGQSSAAMITHGPCTTETSGPFSPHGKRGGSADCPILWGS